MEMPKEFMMLVNDYRPDNLNLLNAGDVAKLFQHVRNLAEAIEYSLESNRYSKDAKQRQALNDFKEWK